MEHAPASYPLPATRYPYRWVILGLGFVNQGLHYGSWYVFPVFFVAMLDEFGWSRGPAAAVFSTFVLVNGFAGPLVGGLTDRYGPRVVIAAGGLLTAVMLAGCASVTELWQFYLWYGVLGGIGVGLGGWISNVAILSRWFPRSIGTASGFTSTGVGLAILLLVPAAQALISAVGWRQAWLWLAALTSLTVPLNLLLQRRPPAHVPDAGADARSTRPRPSTDDLIVDRAWAGRIWTLGLAAGTTRFWLLFVGFFSASFSSQLVLVHAVAFLADSGIDRAAAAWAAGLVGLVSIPGKIAAGPISDRIGRERAWTGYQAAMALGVGALVVASQRPELIYAFPLLVGIGYASTGPLSPAITADVFRGPHFGAIFGAAAASIGVGAAMGAWGAGAIFDLTGSYIAAFVGVVFACALGIICIWLAAPRRVRRVPGTRPSPLAVADRVSV